MSTPVIIAVKYDATRSRIIGVRYAMLLSTGILADPVELKRSEVVQMMNQGTILSTATKQANSLYHLGARLHLLQVDGDVFLRTDNNENPEDNLGNLPEL